MTFNQERNMLLIDEPPTDELPAIDDHFDIRTHNGVITVENTIRGTHRTFRIKTQKADAQFAPNERILSLLVGPENYLQIGFVKDDGHVILWRKYCTAQYDRLVNVLQEPDHYRALGCVYHYEGHCRRCNRALTVPESIKCGMGEVCRAAVAGKF